MEKNARTEIPFWRSTVMVALFYSDGTTGFRRGWFHVVWAERVLAGSQSNPSWTD